MKPLREYEFTVRLRSTQRRSKVEKRLNKAVRKLYDFDKGDRELITRLMGLRLIHDEDEVTPLRAPPPAHDD